MTGKSTRSTKRPRKKRRRRSLAGTAAVVAESAGCNITSRRSVSQLVLDFLHGKGFPAATENSDFNNDIRVTANARRGWAFSLRDIVEARGCEPDGFGPEACANATTVAEIVDALAGALNVS
jgi:hypothetical protein